MSGGVGVQTPIKTSDVTISIIFLVELRLVDHVYMTLYPKNKTRVQTKTTFMVKIKGNFFP